MTGTTAELRTMSLADLATVQRKIAAELSRRLTPSRTTPDASTCRGSRTPLQFGSQ